jgi:UrcA family protein
MSFSNLPLALGAAALALAAASAPGVSAQTVSTVVSYSDLNLNSSEGAKTMFKRIRTAARQACGDEPDIGDIAGFSGWSTCVSDAVNGAIGRLGAPMVTALNEGHGSAQPVILAKAR